MDFSNCYKSFSCFSQMELLLCLQTVLTSQMPWMILYCRLYSVLWVTHWMVTSVSRVAFRG